MSRRDLSRCIGTTANGSRHSPRRDALMASLERIYWGVMSAFGPYCALLTLLIIAHDLGLLD